MPNLSHPAHKISSIPGQISLITFTEMFAGDNSGRFSRHFAVIPKATTDVL
jgi:hypothetical protein